jgi:hypothetical protein
VEEFFPSRIVVGGLLDLLCVLIVITRGFIGVTSATAVSPFKDFLYEPVWVIHLINLVSEFFYVISL